MSPDWAAQEEPVPYAQLDDPQSLNLYSYVRNNPMTRFDPDGHACAANDSLCQALAKAWDTIHDILHPKTLDLPTPAPPKVDRKAWVQSMKSYKPVNGGETVAEIAGRVNHETNGMKDAPGETKPLHVAKKEIAAQRMNAEERYGENVQGRASMVSPLMSGAGYDDALNATVEAAEARNTGADPTSGAYQFNMRTDSQAQRGGPFEGADVHTTSGPYSSPSQYDWIFTYGDK